MKNYTANGLSRVLFNLANYNPDLVVKEVTLKVEEYKDNRDWF